MRAVVNRDIQKIIYHGIQYFTPAADSSEGNKASNIQF